MPRRRAASMWRPGILYVALTILLPYPFSLRPATDLVSPAPDTELSMWALEWDTHAFTHQPLAMFDANICYPQRRTLAYSENLIGSASHCAGDCATPASSARPRSRRRC